MKPPSVSQHQPCAWAAAMRRLGMALTAFSVLPVCFLLPYTAVFGAPASALLPHLWVLAAALAGLAGLRLCIALLPVDERLRRALAAFLLSAGAMAMLGFYVAVLLGLQYWGRVTSVDLATTYLAQSGDLLHTLGHRPEWWAGGLACAAAMLWWMVYLYLKSHDWTEPLMRGLSRRVAAALGFGLIAVASVSAVELPNRDWSVRGEPLSLSLYPERGETRLQSHAISQARASRIDRFEDQVRARYRPNASARRSNVIVVVVDALRADHLALLGYDRPTTPELQALARAGHVHLATSIVTVCNESACGLRALSSSRYLDSQGERPITLPELLKHHGYGVHYLLSGDHTNFYGLRSIYGVSDSYFDGASQRARYANDDRLVQDGLRALGRWDGKPVMLQLHLMSTHGLGKRFDDVPEFGPGQNYYEGLRRLGQPVERMRAVNFYDRGVLQTDRLVKQILDELAHGGYLQDALVVLTGDHGEELGERGRFGHGHSVWEEGLRVPFLLMAFGNADAGTLAAGRVASQVDVAPTLLHALGMPIPETWEGEPLQLAKQGRIVFFQQQQQIGLIDARDPARQYKHWRDLRNGQRFTFDLTADPKEYAEITSEVPSELLYEWQRLLIARSSATGTAAESGLDEFFAKGERP